MPNPIILGILSIFFIALAFTSYKQKYPFYWTISLLTLSIIILLPLLPIFKSGNNPQPLTCPTGKTCISDTCTGNMYVSPFATGDYGEIAQPRGNYNQKCVDSRCYTMNQLLPEDISGGYSLLCNYNQQDYKGGDICKIGSVLPTLKTTFPNKICVSSIEGNSDRIWGIPTLGIQEGVSDIPETYINAKLAFEVSDESICETTLLKSAYIAYLGVSNKQCKEDQNVSDCNWGGGDTEIMKEFTQKYGNVKVGQLTKLNEYLKNTNLKGGVYIKYLHTNNNAEVTVDVNQVPNFVQDPWWYYKVDDLKIYDISYGDINSKDGNSLCGRAHPDKNEGGTISDFWASGDIQECSVKGEINQPKICLKENVNIGCVGEGASGPNCAVQYLDSSNYT